MIDEKSAIVEIKSISLNARHYLQHMLRNGLQSVLAGLEEGSSEEAAECVKELSCELGRLGL
ncbi:MAG TPA: hypothetical protein DDW94_05280 [Deltaproteobacteria bacterium]|nr:MAG: hypothetical protein A2Z79_04675 [Deltaproteobacteria bacterium GWA2_55_82]OGQ61975.1 MAG: hypothetical protein A3I81_13200 [Deltaproteobacteria bacterium RIFCSPLOWO2_02_FULL_55_12]OIJ74670.1 MAG: hypothetical protein A2V21_310585 [Deltaproteobacteria bacterium GWC2_55_46]HBG46386.1 hypothetical protein [Deltaproteobacteria bacterium]HCY10597.1 hypothetical protein [Deltaproteobacteria bacterium]